MSPEYARRIKKLRAALQLTQHELAERLRVRPQVVASWEQGRKVPSASSYRGLADLAPPEQAWFFLEQMGITKKLVRAKWQQRDSKLSRSSVPSASLRAAWRSHAAPAQIPLLRQGLAGGPRRIAAADIERAVSLPPGVLSVEPGRCLGLLQRGNSMAPILQDRFLVVVDRTVREPAKLTDRVVAVWTEAGIELRWLTLDEQTGGLLLRPENSRYPTVPLDAAKNRVVGKVVFWWGTQA